MITNIKIAMITVTIIIMIIIKVLIIVIIFKTITTTTIIIIIIIIITDRYLKLIRSSYRYCFPHCSLFEKNAF